MKKNQRALWLTLTAIAISGGACAHLMHEGDDEKPIAIEQVPQAPKAAIQTILGGQKADKIVMEDEDGKKVYEVTYHVNGQERSADVALNGDVLEQEADVAVTALPANVSGAIMAKYPGAKISEASEVTAGGQKFYEAGVTLSNGTEHEVQVNGDGSIRADKTEKKEKDKD